MPRQIKVLIFGESPALPTSVAEITRSIFGYLIKNHPREFNLLQVGLFHSHAVTKPSWPVYATEAVQESGGGARFVTDDLFGQRTLHRTIGTFEPDILVALGNPHDLMRSGLGETKLDCRLLLYLKIDDFPLLPAVGPLLERADLILTISRFSLDVIRSQFPDTLKVGCMYPPANVQSFCSLPPDERRGLRAEVFPDWMPANAFVLGWVGKARWRKQIWAAYQTIHLLRSGEYLVCNDCGGVTLFAPDAVPGGSAPPAEAASDPCGICVGCLSRNLRPAEPLADIFLWLHTPETDPASDWPVRRLENEYRVQRNRDIFYTDGLSPTAGLAPEDMPSLYQVWDALLYLTGSEGLGLPGWEAMCSGLPVIYTSFSSHSEYLRRSGGGLPATGSLQPECKTGLLRFIPDVASAIQAVRRIYYDRRLGRALGANGRTFALRYRVEVQAERWRRLLRQLAPSPEKGARRRGSKASSVDFAAARQTVEPAIRRS